MQVVVTTKPGKKYRSIRKPKVYEALRRQGMSKERAARISNAQAHKAFTIQQLEAFVSSPHYDATTADLIARGIPALKAADGELISPGIRRIRGNLCNVHGRYGPCDAALSGKKKPKKGRAPAKPKQTPEQRAQARSQQRQTNIDSVAKRMADTDTGLSPSGSKALTAFAKGQQPDSTTGKQLAQMGLAEQAADGSFRMTPTGRGVVSAMAAGDYQRAVDGISRATDTQGKRTERQTAAQTRQADAAKKRQDASGKRASAAIGRELTKRQPKPVKAASGGSKKPAAHEQAPERPRAQAKPKRAARSSAPTIGGGTSGTSPKPKPAAPKPEKAPAKQIAPALQDAADQLSQGAELSDDDTQALIRNGLAKLNKDGQLILTAAGMRATTKGYTGALAGVAGINSPRSFQTMVNSAPHAQKTTRDPVSMPGRISTDSRQTRWQAGQTTSTTIATPPVRSIAPSFRVFKDANGQPRWVAQSSTAFQDRDREIVSTKALADDCQFADESGSYGPLRWWHTPGLDLGDCDFNAMHGRVLIESGTFRGPAIAQKVAAAAAGLEISLGFLHLPNEPDADGVFHHIRRFERSLVPRGKASNRFTAFTVKEIPRMDATKKNYLKTELKFSDEEIADIEATATSTEKAATDQGVAYKADEVAVRYQPGERFKAADGEEYIKSPSDLDPTGMYYASKATKAFPPKKDDAAAIEDVIEEDAIDDMPLEEEEEADDDTALTLSSGDIQAIAQAVAPVVTASMQEIAAQIMGGLDLEKKVAGHVQGFLAPMQQAQTTKDAETAQTRETIAQIQQQVAELTGDQPSAKPYRASAAKDTVLTDATMLAAAKQLQDPNAGPFDDVIRGLGLIRPQ